MHVFYRRGAIIPPMKLIVGNWKMYPKTIGEAKKIFAAIKRAAARAPKTKTVICAPHPYIPVLLVARGRVAVGAQDCFWEDEGARTGEVSPAMIASLGASHVILGHSERRALGETNEEVAWKAKAAVTRGLTVILCVGEKARDEQGTYYAEVRDQLIGSLAGFSKVKVAMRRLIIAYEPIWAIGRNAKRAASPADHREMSIHIRRHLADLFGKKDAFRIPILYGGSVDDGNAEGFLRDGAADGFLIGRVSLDPERFGNIIALAARI